MQDIQLIIEAGDDGFWGRVTHNDDLIADQAETVEALQQNMKKLLLNFHKAPMLPLRWPMTCSPFPNDIRT